MKKTLLAIAGIAMMFSVMSCGTTEEATKAAPKGPDTVVGSGLGTHVDPTFVVDEIRIVDYPGKTFGEEIPQWVRQIAKGNYSASAFIDIMPDVGNYELFVASAKGPNLDFIKQWTNLVDIETEVAGIMQRVVGKALQTFQGATQTEGHTLEEGTVEDIDMEKTEKMYQTSVSNVNLVGLRKITEYWVESIAYDGETGAPKDRYFDYYVVYGMDKKIYESSLASALGQIPTATDTDVALKSLVMESLTNQMMGGESGFKAE